MIVEKTKVRSPEIEISAFWMSKTEISWDVYDVWASDLDIFRRKMMNLKASPRDALAEPFKSACRPSLIPT